MSHCAKRDDATSGDAMYVMSMYLPLLGYDHFFSHPMEPKHLAALFNLPCLTRKDR